jgi:hypothetical protein
VCFETTFRRKSQFTLANKVFENVANFKYFGTTVTNKSCVHEEIKSRLNSEMLASILFRAVSILYPL